MSSLSKFEQMGAERGEGGGADGDDDGRAEATVIEREDLPMVVWGSKFFPVT